MLWKLRGIQRSIQTRRVSSDSRNYRLFVDPDHEETPSSSLELADTEVNTINDPMDDIEIVPVKTLEAGDSDERYDTGSGGSVEENATGLAVPTTRVFSPEGTEFLTPMNSPPPVSTTPAYPGDELGEVTEAAELPREIIVAHATVPNYANIPNLDQYDSPDTSDLKRYKPYLARATEEDELRKIQALEDEIMSGKSETDDKDDQLLEDGGRRDDVLFPIDDVVLRPPSVPSVEYHDDAATPVPGNFHRDRESGSDNERKSTHSQGSKGSRPDSVPQLALSAAVVKTDDECSNDEGEADDEKTNRSADETPVPGLQPGYSASSIVFPDLSPDLSAGRDPCDEIMNKIDNELLVINENIARAHSPEASSSPYRKSPTVHRRSPIKRKSPSPQGNYLKNQRSKQSPSTQYDEPMSVRTEDFAEQFQHTIVPTPKSTDRILAKLQRLQDTLNDLRRPGDPSGAPSSGEAAKQSGPVMAPTQERGRQPAMLPNGFYPWSIKRLRSRSAEPRLPKPGPGRERQVESDLESVQTEDFLREYRKTMVPTAKRAESDAESVKTEEYEKKYRDYLINTQKNLLQNELDREKRVAASRPPQAPAGPRKYRDVLKSYKKRGYDSASEIDTARTDDIEYNPAAKHVAGVNVESFDEVLVDSDVDTVKSAEVRNKLRNAMANSKGRVYTPSEVSEDDINERQYRDYIARKLTEISRLPRIDASASDVDKQDEEEGDVDRDYDDESDVNADDVMQSQQRLEMPAPQYDFYDQDDLTSQDEEVKHNTSEIHRESRRIAREMEDERRKRILQQQQQQARVAKSIERLPVKATENFSAKSPERRQAPLRAARSLDRLPRSPPKSPDVRRIDRARLDSIEKAVFAKEIKEKLVELQVLADTVDEAKTEKRVLINELRGLRDAFNDSQNELKLANMHSKDYKSKADELKTELTLLEYKRSQTQQELEDTEKNLATKKQRMDELDQHIKENLDRLKDFEELGMTAEQVKGILCEKDKLESEVGKREAVGQERDMLKEKLLQTKEELYEAEKRNRVKIDGLEEKLDALVKQTQDLHTDKSYLQQQLRMLEEKHDKAIEDKDIVIHEKERDYDNLHRTLQAEVNDLKQEALVDTSRLKQEIEGLQVKVMSLQEDLDEKNEENTKLRDQILDLQCDLNRESELREKESQEHQDNKTKLEVDKDAAVTEVRHRLYTEKQHELQEAYDLFEQERRELANKQENKLAEQLAHHHQELIARDEENQMLREQVRIAEEAARTAEEKAQKSAKEQADSEIETERKKWEAERDRVWKLELAKISGESVRAVQQAREDAEREKDICQHLERQIEIIKQELEEQRQANRAAYKDKLDSIGRLKETAREERESAIERARTRAIEEGNREIERLKLQLETKNEEIKRMRAEAEEARSREVENQGQAEKHDKTIIHEINEDCKKTALLLGVTPRKAVTGPRRPRESSPTRSAVNAALANLRACNEQLRGYVLELKQEIDNQRSVMVNIQREKEEALTDQKEKLSSEKTAEMDMLRERLIKDHMEELVRLQERSPDKAMKQALIDKDAELREIQRNMNVWKEEVAEKFAKKFEEELNRELDKRTRDIKRNLRDKDRTLTQQQRDIERLEREVARLTVASATNNDDSETIKLLRHLQNRVKELRSENNQLKRSNMLSTAVLDTGNDSIKNGGCDASCRTLENRIKQAELRAELSEERAARNEQLLNTKISEIARLQGALTHQTKEVMQLERAYKNLQAAGPLKR